MGITASDTLSGANCARFGGVQFSGGNAQMSSAARIVLPFKGTQVALTLNSTANIYIMADSDNENFSDQFTTAGVVIYPAVPLTFGIHYLVIGPGSAQNGVLADAVTIMDAGGNAATISLEDAAFEAAFPSQWSLGMEDTSDTSGVENTKIQYICLPGQHIDGSGTPPVRSYFKIIDDSSPNNEPGSIIKFVTTGTGFKVYVGAMGASDNWVVDVDGAPVSFTYSANQYRMIKVTGLSPGAHTVRCVRSQVSQRVLIYSVIPLGAGRLTTVPSIPFMIWHGDSRVVIQGSGLICGETVVPFSRGMFAQGYDLLLCAEAGKYMLTDAANTTNPVGDGTSELCGTDATSVLGRILAKTSGTPYGVITDGGINNVADAAGRYGAWVAGTDLSVPIEDTRLAYRHYCDALVAKWPAVKMYIFEPAPRTALTGRGNVAYGPHPTFQATDGNPAGAFQWSIAVGNYASGTYYGAARPEGAIHRWKADNPTKAAQVFWYTCMPEQADGPLVQPMMTLVGGTYTDSFGYYADGLHQNTAGGAAWSVWLLHNMFPPTINSSLTSCTSTSASYSMTSADAGWTIVTTFSLIGESPATIFVQSAGTGTGSVTILFGSPPNYGPYTITDGTNVWTLESAAACAPSGIPNRVPTSGLAIGSGATILGI